jgi:thioredoxin reductase
MAKSGAPRLAILGAGPIGLEAGLYAKSLGLPFTIYERGRVAEHVLRWGHVRLFSPFGINSTPLGRSAIAAHRSPHEFPGDDACLTGREYVAKYLTPLAETLQGNIQTETQVLRIGRQDAFKMDMPGDARRAASPFRLLVRDKTRERVEEAEVVLDCTGTYGQHRWAGAGGVPAPGELGAEMHIAYGLEDILGERKAHYANKTTLIVGSGYSAATSACALADLAKDHPTTWVVWIGRGKESTPLKRIASDPLKERDRLAARANNLATRKDDNVDYYGGTVLEAIEFLGQDKGFKITTRGAPKVRTLEVERIIANVGYTPDTNLYRELQIHESYDTLGPVKLAAALAGSRVLDCLKQPGVGADALTNPEPNFYILGSKSYGRNSNFLLRAGFEQVRDVFTLITGTRKLDLYSGKK